MRQQIALVNYLSLDANPPELVATVCTGCCARYFGHRVACARCGARAFTQEPAARTGRVGSFSIVHRAPKGVDAPFVSAIVDLDDGAFVKANIVGCPPTPDHIRLGMCVELTTFDVGTDDNGTTAVAFGFTPSKGATA